MRIGVFGGTFDPPHVGHLVAATNVQETLELDRVIFVVANIPWQKVEDREVTAAEDRLAMVRAAVAGVDEFEACAMEIDRGGPSYTADTLAELGARYPDAELFLILGSDAAAGVLSWERHEEIRELAQIVVVDRPGRVGVRPPSGWSYTVVECPMLDVSSTDIRARVSSGRSVAFLIPEGVDEFIRERGIYRWGSE